VEEADVPKLAGLLRGEWENELARSGLGFVQPKAAAEAGGVSCPACGTCAPLVEGACSDCGLTLG
jgi:hypothetical protein